MISLSRRYRSGSAARPDSGGYLPPDPRNASVEPFGAAQRQRLAAWLREGAWKRGHMEMAELEGYLVGLLVWPVAMQSGAWLPAIWGERGWRVPTKLAARPLFDEFVALIIGLLRDLDRQLEDVPARFEHSILRQLGKSELAKGLHLWGRGFMTALTLGSQGFQGRNAVAREAVETIAGITAAAAPFRNSAVEDVVGAVFALASQRISRGPLGPHAVLESPDAPK